MARAPTKARGAAGSRSGLRTRKTVEYNVQKLSDKSVEVPKPPKKAAAPKKKAGKKTKKTGATYLVLIKRALKDVDAPGWGLESIVKHLAASYPDKNNRRAIRLALQSGVDTKIFVKTRASWRLSKKTLDKMAKKSTKKKTTKKATTKKATTKKSATKKKTTKKSTTKKSTTKKAATKKKTTKKSTTKKEKAPKKKTTTTKKTTTKKAPAEKKKTASKKRAAEDDSTSASPSKKKVIGPPASDDTGGVSEAVGKWQYYDGGWCNYTDDASRIVEGVYQEYQHDTTLHVRPVQSGHFSYSVNFKELEQTNTSTGTMRKIRRI